MIIALLALAFAMIVGGLFAAFFGWDIVLVERGWTMVIAGSVMAASGAILLGIAAAVSKLAVIETRLSQLQGGFDEEALLAAPKSSKGLSLAALSGGLVAGKAAVEADEGERPDEAQPTLPLFEDEDGREKAEEKVEIAAWPEEPLPRDTVLPFPPRTIPAPSREEDEPDMKVPDFLLADRARDADEEPRVIDGADIYHRDMDEDEQGPRDREERPEPVVEILPDLEPEPDHEPTDTAEIDRQEEPELEPEGAASDASHPPAVVGTYNSGDNKYVMFSDGSIEAQTPSGVFRFQSLDELKEFIAAGGEGNTPPVI
jgi:hypothetical protein